MVIRRPPARLFSYSGTQFAWSLYDPVALPRESQAERLYRLIAQLAAVSTRWHRVPFPFEHPGRFRL